MTRMHLLRDVEAKTVVVTIFVKNQSVQYTHELTQEELSLDLNTIAKDLENKLVVQPRDVGFKVNTFEYAKQEDKVLR